MRKSLFPFSKNFRIAQYESDFEIMQFRSQITLEMSNLKAFFFLNPHQLLEVNFCFWTTKYGSHFFISKLHNPKRTK